MTEMFVSRHARLNYPYGVSSTDYFATTFTMYSITVEAQLAGYVRGVLTTEREEHTLAMPSHIIALTEMGLVFP